VTARIAWALVLAVPVAIGLAVFAQNCGAIHGSPRCGGLSTVAVPIVVFALVAEGLMFQAPQGDATIWLLVGGVSFVIAFALCFAVLTVASRMRGH
jgi:hypothetical protein